MSQTVPAKIVLKSTTKMSLNDRFTTIQKMRPPPMNPQEVRAQMAATQQSTQQNRRLAQQMANRPSVQAALGTGGGGRGGAGGQMGGGNRKTLKQRLGPSNVKSRLNLTLVGGGGGNQSVRGLRGGRGAQTYRRPRGRGRGGNISASMVDLNGAPRGRAGRGFRGRGFRGSRGGTQRWIEDDRRPPRGRGGGRWFGRRGSDTNVNYTSRGGRGRARGRGGDRGASGRGRGQFQQRGRGGRGGRGRGRSPSFSRDDLDNQLEEYMSKTKTHLDTELDSYMAQSDML